ncbi:MAG: hypothetical protein JW728_07640 [Candidatus Aureabacteria bacterium]|nr:hypothetical protein [Candidatus Auribacterota bacterium]
MDNKEEKQDINKEPIIELPDVEQLIGSKNIKSDPKQQKPLPNIPAIKIESKPEPAAEPEKKSAAVRPPEATASAPKVPEKKIPVLTKPTPAKENVEMASAETEDVREDIKPVQKPEDKAKEFPQDKPAISEDILKKITADSGENSRPKLRFRKNDGSAPDEPKAETKQSEGVKSAAAPTIHETKTSTSRQVFEHQEYSPVEQTGIMPSVIIILSVIFISIAAYLAIIQYFNLPVPSFIRNIIDAVYSASS